MTEPPPREQFGHTEGWRGRLYRVIYEHDTPGGRAFDVALLAAIALSVAAVMLESVAEVRRRHGALLVAVEWAFTGLFTVEYVLRLLCVRRPLRYALSFYGLVDLLAVVPTYVGLLVAGAHELLVIRALRLLRIFRVLKMGEYLVEAGTLKAALQRSRPKITVFLVTVLTVVIVVGALMHLVEGPQSGFTSIPMSVYWAIVTLTTVGYGDIAPRTALGRLLAAAVMILGYGIIAVPTGIVTAELVRGERASARERRRWGERPPGARDARRCPMCGAAGQDADAASCKYCGGSL